MQIFSCAKPDAPGPRVRTCSLLVAGCADVTEPNTGHNREFMPDYDVALKLLLRGSARVSLNEITGGAGIAKWLDIELPKVQKLRADCWVKLRRAILFISSCEAQTTIPWPRECSNTAPASFACAADFRGKFCSMSVGRPCERSPNCAALA